MWFAYLDESKENNSFYVYSALIVDASKWHEAFKLLKDARIRLRDRRGVYLKQELHAWKFAAGKGQIAPRAILKPERAEIFRRVLSFVAEHPDFFQIISSVNTNEFYAFDRIMNRINRTAKEKGEQVILICDKGQEAEFTKRMRRMRIHNPVPSKLNFGRKEKRPRTYLPSKFLKIPSLKIQKNLTSFKWSTFARMRFYGQKDPSKAELNSVMTLCMRS